MDCLLKDLNAGPALGTPSNRSPGEIMFFHCGSEWPLTSIIKLWYFWTQYLLPSAGTSSSGVSLILDSIPKLKCVLCFWDRGFLHGMSMPQTHFPLSKGEQLLRTWSRLFLPSSETGTPSQTGGDWRQWNWLAQIFFQENCLYLIHYVPEHSMGCQQWASKIRRRTQPLRACQAGRSLFMGGEPWGENYLLPGGPGVGHGLPAVFCDEPRKAVPPVISSPAQ